MAWIQFAPADRGQIDRRYREWGSRQPKEPGQIGSVTLFSVEGPFGELQLPDAFVDELERSAIPFERRP